MASAKRDGFHVFCIVLGAVVAVALASFVGYYIYYGHLAETDYKTCKGVTLPTDLNKLDVIFGKPEGSRVVSGGGDVITYYEPSPFYSFTWSTDIEATTHPASKDVIDLYCGEGW